MVATFGELKKRIALELGEDQNADLSVEIDRAVKDAIEYYSDEPIWFLETSATATMQAGTTAYDLPADLVTLDEVTVRAGGDDLPVEQVHWDRYRRLQTDPDGITGQPFKFALYGAQVHFHPTPGEAYPYTLYYRRRLPELVQAFETNAWITHGWRLLRSHAEADLATHILRTDPGGAADPARFMAAAELELRKLRRKSEARMAPGYTDPRPF